MVQSGERRPAPARPYVQSKEGIRMSTQRDGDSAGLRRDPVASVTRNDHATVVALAGELDLYNAEGVREALFAAAADADRLVVDLSEVQFIDSTALGVLIEARSKLADKRNFLLAAPQLETRRALEISGLDRHFAIVASVDEALA
jgi:anti-sigma B factor antagonist